jgi:DNA-binding transcriptional ArsR family regulator
MKETAFVDVRIMQALSHPIRGEILRMLASEVSLSPMRALSLLPSSKMISLSQMNYHVWSLGRDGLVERAGSPSCPDRGITYRATAKGA